MKSKKWILVVLTATVLVTLQGYSAEPEVNRGRITTVLKNADSA